MRLTIFIGCYNEKATILKAIEEAKAVNLDKEIIVIDNCSTDGTREILKGLRDESIRVIFNEKNMGAGYSAHKAIQMAKGDYFFGPGADLEYRMEEVRKMMTKIENENLDAIFGSRLLDRKDVSMLGLIKERPFWLGTIIATFLVNLLYRKNFTDVIGINLVKTQILRDLDCRSSSQAFTFELVSRLCKKGQKIGEVPLWYHARTHKEGKTIRALDIIPAVWVMLRVKFRG